MFQNSGRAGTIIILCGAMACTMDSGEDTMFAEADVGGDATGTSYGTSEGTVVGTSMASGTPGGPGGIASTDSGDPVGAEDSGTWGGALTDGDIALEAEGGSTSTSGEDGIPSASTSGEESTSTRGEESTSSGDASSGDVADGECSFPHSSDEVTSIEALSDEFDDPSTFCSWKLLHEEEGDPSPIRSLDITETEQGFLTLIPETSGWYADYTGPFLFKEIEGDFRVDVSVTASSFVDFPAAPSMPFTSAGLLIRDPASVPGAQNWVMWDIGRQLDDLGTEGKTTVNSNSQLLTTPGVASGTLRLCRRGEIVELALRDPSSGTFAIVHQFERADFPATLQVGLVTTAWNGTAAEPNFDLEPDLIATWDYFRVAPLTDDCVTG